MPRSLGCWCMGSLPSAFDERRTEYRGLCPLRPSFVCSGNMGCCKGQAVHGFTRTPQAQAAILLPRALDCWCMGSLPSAFDERRTEYRGLCPLRPSFVFRGNIGCSWGQAVHGCTRPRHKQPSRCRARWVAGVWGLYHQHLMSGAQSIGVCARCARHSCVVATWGVARVRRFTGSHAPGASSHLDAALAGLLVYGVSTISI